jgi:hypothetical protein
MKNYSRLTQVSIYIFVLFHILVFIYFCPNFFGPYDGSISSNESMSEFLLGFFLFLSGIGLFIYSLFLFLSKYSKESWGAGIPLAISSFTWVMIMIIIPLFNSTFDTFYQIHKEDFNTSALLMIETQNETWVHLPYEYRYLSVTGGVRLSNGRVFYMQSIGMMGEEGPGYLYDPESKPEEVCTKSSVIFWTKNWYECDLNWKLLRES